MDSNTFIPPAFIEKMAHILPDNLNINDLLDACRRPLRKAIRVNTLKISIEDFLSLAQQKNWTLTPVPWCAEGFWIDYQSKQRL